MPKVVNNEERRDELTDAAARLIARSGLGAATIRSVAAEAGWTTGVVTHYFPDKRTLLLRTFEASLQHRQARRTASEPLPALRETLVGALPIDEDRRRHWKVSVAFCTEATGDPELAATQATTYRTYRSYVASLVDAAGLADPGAAESADDHAESLLTLVNGIAIQSLFDPDRWSADHQLEALSRGVARLGLSVLFP
ncbi:MAG: TetR/AcrR family transcriptional regulator [Ilumatobacteraceae bacterium]